MNNKILYTFLVITQISLAQIHELGPMINGTNYIGEIGKDNYISPNNFGYGLIYKWNKSPRHAYRLHYNFGRISADDNQVVHGSRAQRGLSFDNRIHEIGIGLEFNFLDFDMHQFGTQFTPYVASGINVFNYKEQYFANNTLFFDENKWSYSVPIILGLKTKIDRHLVIGFEIGARYTFTDNLDGSNPSNSQFTQLKFGNINSNDWYVFTSFYLTYTFGDNPCFCPF